MVLITANEASEWKLTKLKKNFNSILLLQLHQYKQWKFNRKGEVIIKLKADTKKCAIVFKKNLGDPSRFSHNPIFVLCPSPCATMGSSHLF